MTRLEGRVREVEAELTAAREQCSKLEAVNEQLEAAREEVRVWKSGGDAGCRCRP